MRTTFFLSLALTVIGGVVPVSAAEAERAVICHASGNSGQVTLELPAAALKGHLKHGDTLGACGVANQPPLANAGPDQTERIGVTVLLDGSASTDGDGDPLTFLWSFQSRPAGSAATLADPSAVHPSFAIDQPGTYVVQLVVHDGKESSLPDSVQISTSNSPPVADAGADQTVFVSQTAMLDGSGSNDVDGDVLTFQWQFVSLPAGSAATLSDPSAVNPSFVADVPGSYAVQLIVHDGLEASAPDGVTISTENSAPVADAGADQSATTGDLVQLDGSGSSDPDGTPVQFSWSLTTVPAGSAATISDPLAANPTFEADVAGLYIAQLIVSDGQLASAPDTSVITVADLPVVTVSAPDHASEAGLDPGTFVVTRAGPTNGELTVFYTIAGTAMPGTDYHAVSGSVSIGIGETSDVVSIVPIDDLLLEGDETVELTLSAGPGYTVGAEGSGTVTIADDELPAVTITAADENAAESGLDPGELVLSRTGPTSNSLVVEITITGTAMNGADYETIDSVVTFAPGEAAIALTVMPLDDTLIEGAESVTLIVAEDPAYSRGTPHTATVSISDDDVPVVTIVASDPDASEAGPTPAVFTFTRTGDAANPLVVSFTRSGTATGGNVGEVDYEPLGSLVTFPAGESSIDLVLLPRQDNRVEGPEAATLTISPGGDIVVGTPSVATVTIADDPPVVTVTATDPDASEAGADPGVFTFERTGGNIAAPLTIATSFGGTAANASDFALVSALVSIPANATSAMLTIVPRTDNRVEGAETMEVTIVPSSGLDSYVIGTPGAAIVTIADDPPVVSVTATDPDAAEAGADPGAFTFTRSGGDLSAQLTLIVARGGTATSGIDYGSIGGSNFLVAIAAGEVSTVVTITPLDDAIVDPDETVIVTVQPSASYAIGASGSATVTITDDD